MSVRDTLINALEQLDKLEKRLYSIEEQQKNYIAEQYELERELLNHRRLCGAIRLQELFHSQTSSNVREKVKSFESEDRSEQRKQSEPKEND